MDGHGADHKILRTTTGELYSAVVWSDIEACVGIFCASVPALKPLAQRYAPILLSPLSSMNKRTGKTSRETGESSYAEIELSQLAVTVEMKPAKTLSNSSSLKHLVEEA
jgi:hypothetical protein